MSYGSEYMRELRKTQEYKDQYNEWYKTYYRTSDGWATVNLSKIKTKCKKENIPFNLTKEDLIPPEICPVLGIKIELGEKDHMDSGPSTDKIIPRLGYLKGNVRVISGRANRLKSDATAEELENIAAYIRDNS